MNKCYIYILLFFTSFSLLFSNDEYFIYDTGTKTKITIDELVNSSTKSDVIFFGEFHNDSLIHYLQKIYLEKFYAKHNNTSVSLEMFERDVQSELNSYLSGEKSEEEFLANSRPWPDYKKFYRPLVELAKSHKSQVLAANIPRKYAAMYVQGGFRSYDTLDKKDRAYISKDMVFKEDAYLDKFLETMAGSKDIINELTYNQINTLYLYYGAQCIKDETMAESIYEYNKIVPQSKIIHFNGDFHSNSYLGTVDKLKRRNSNLKISVITPIYFDKESEIDFAEDLSKKANYILYIQKDKEEDEQMMMSGTSHFGENFAINHSITLDITPSNSMLYGEDKITFQNPIIKSTSVRLLKDLEVISVSDKNKNIKFNTKPIDDFYNEIIFENASLNKPSNQGVGIIETKELTITYRGKVNYSPSETNMTTRHSNTPGVISPKEEEGIYLTAGSFYPYTNKDMATFQAFVTLPKNYKLVTSGKMRQHENSKGILFNINVQEKIDDLILVAGVFNVESIEHKGIKFNMFYKGENKYVSQYLEESKKYYDMYSELFGKYPYSSFNIVENFFATGFGMPGFTLLSDKLIAMPWVTLSPGSLAHEFVHNWWGNSVFVDYNYGNWCEALTTFSTNYYYNVLTNNKEGEIDYRRKALMAIDELPEEKNYPVNDFKYQRDTYDAVIGYSKGAFVFQEIMKLIGKDNFFNSLKSFATKYQGRRAYWMNLSSEFASNSDKLPKDINLRTVINELTKTTEIPEIKFAEKPIYDNNKLNLKINNSLKRVTNIPISIYYDKDGKDFSKEYYILKDSINSIEITTKSKPYKVEIDNEFETLRKIFAWEKPTSLNKVLQSKPVVVLPKKTSKDFVVAMNFAKYLKDNGFDFDYNTVDSYNEYTLDNNSLILLGNTENNDLIKEYTKNLPDNLVLTDTYFKYDENSVALSENILMSNVEHLTNKNKHCTIISFSDLKDISPLKRLIHYQSYSLVLLNINRTGRPIYSTEIYPKSADKSSLIWVND